MRKRMGAALAVTVGLCAGQLGAQTLREVSAPVNPPPASFKGQQFIDARGCAFVRAGFGGVVNWVPRIDGARKPICGLQPTGGGAPVAAAAPEVAPAPRPARPGFWASLFAAPAPAAQAPAPDLVLTVTPPEPTAPRVLPKPPRGWKYAWADDRLNPMRGVGTVEGEAAQDRAFTREVPMQARADLPVKPAAKPVHKPAVTVSTMSAPGGLMIQVGAFGDPGNAQRSQDRIAALGLPVATSGHRGLTVVLAGPFASAEAARAGVAALRAAGFGDAFLR